MDLDRRFSEIGKGIGRAKLAPETPTSVYDAQTSISVHSSVRSERSQFGNNPHGRAVVEFVYEVFETRKMTVYMVAGEVSKAPTMVF